LPGGRGGGGAPPLGAACYWNAGGSLSGDAVYDQADYFNNGGLAGPSSVVPAFALNTVPEPGYGALLSIPALFWLARSVKNRVLSRRK